MAPRSIWSGAISFGLVTVPVKMVTATESKELKFHFLHKDDLVPIGYDKVRKDTGEHVDPEDVVRGFEIEKGRYVPITEEDIDPIYFRKAYYLVPAEGAEKPYTLLVRALDETGKVGIAKVVIRNKQHLACLRTYEGVLVLETMYYDDEVRKPSALDGDAKTGRIAPAEVEMAKTLVENLSEKFDPTKYDDNYRKELLELIRAKAKGQKLPEPQAEEEGEVVDLMAALRESVERTKRQRASTRRSSSRKSSAAKRKSSSSGTKRKSAARKAS